MKNTLRSLVVISLVLAANVTHAADVSNFLVAKGQEFVQTNSAPPTQVLTNEPFRGFASVTPSVAGLVTGVNLTLPGGVTVFLEDEGDGVFEGDTGHDTKAELDAELKPGTYNFTIFTVNDGTNRPSLSLPKDDYPATPRILNWSDAQEIERAADFTFHWGAFTNGNSNDFIVFDIATINDDDPVFSTPDILETNVFTGTNTSATVPAGTLESDTTYQGRLLFVKRTTNNTNSIPGATGFAGYYKETIFPLATLPTESGPGRIQFGASQFVLPETQTGELLIPIYRTSASLTGDVSVELTISDGTATAGLDYYSATYQSVLTFSNGFGYVGIPVFALDDSFLDANETFSLTLANPTGGAVLGSRSNTIVVITDNESTANGRLQFSPVAVPVTEAGKNAILTVTRTGGTTGPATIQFATVNGSATGGIDFTHTNGVLNFASGQTSRQILVPILNDVLDETNETFTVTLTNSTGGAFLGSNLVATVTITDDDTAGIITFKSAAISTNENAGAALVTLSRAGGKAGGVTVFYHMENGLTNGATSGVDYTDTSGSVTFNSNDVTKTFSIPLTNDLDVETNETVRLFIDNVTGRGARGSLSNAVLTILDDESNISFTNVAFTATETGLKATINLVRTGARITPVAVSYSTVDGTAVSTNDYRGTNNSVVFFPANVGFKTITIPVVNDTIVDSNETFNVFLHSPTGGVTLGTITNATVTVTDNDAGGAISFTMTNFNVTEIGPVAKILLSRTGGSASGVSVTLTSEDGSATAGADYTALSTNVTFKSGELARTIALPVSNDSLDETNEIVHLALSNPTGGASLGSRSNAVLTILDDDIGGTISLSSVTYTTNENAAAFLVTVNRTVGKASNAGVSYSTFDGTAAAPGDFTQTEGILTFGSNELSKVVSIPVVNDTESDGNETLSFRIFTPTGGATLGANTNATLTIRDDESSVSFTNAAFIVTEAGPAISVNVVREGSLITQVGVAYSTADDDATSPGDYRGTNGFLVFPPNIGFRTITIPIVNDTIVEGDESFGLSLHSPTGGVQFATGPGHFTNATVTITDNDIGGVINLKSATFSTNENASAIITITRTNGAASGVNVTLSVENGSATSPDDFVVSSLTVTFAANQTSTNVPLPIINDTLDETNETVNLALSNVTGGASLGSISNAVLTILDNDSGGTIQFSALSYTTNEGAAVLNAVVIRTNGVASDVTVDFFTTPGTAVAGSDFTSTNGTLTFNAGETNKLIPVAIIDDALPDGSKSFSINLTNPTGGSVLGVRSNATMNITDDENSVVIESASYTTNESAGTISIRLLRTGVLSSQVSLTCSTSNGTATAGSDYVGTNLNIIFPAGSSFAVVPVRILNDFAIESAESFTVALHSPGGGVQIGSTSNAVVNITDDDTAGTIRFSSSTYSGSEGTSVNVQVQRISGLASNVTVQFNMVNGTAGSNDYSNVSQLLTFAAGETNKNISVALTTDNITESIETVNLSLVNPTGGSALGSPNTATLNINNASGITCPPVTFNLTGPGMKATAQGAAFTALNTSGALVSGILSVSGLAADKTISFVIPGVPVGSTGSFQMSTGNDFFGYSTSTFSFSGNQVCSTTKTYNSESPGSGCINIIEWDTVNRVFKATFNFTAKGSDCSTVCGTTSTPCSVPTDSPVVTQGQVWVVYNQSP